MRWNENLGGRTMCRLTLATVVLALAFGVLVAPPASAVDGPSAAVDIEVTPDEAGYWTLDRYGRVTAVGSATYFGGSPQMAAGEEAVALAATPTGAGYWVFTSIGRVIAYGDAVHRGDIPQALPDTVLNGPILDTAVTSSGNGYYMLGSDGGIFTFGDAVYHGSIQEIVNDLFGIGFPASDWLNAPIVGIAATDTGGGYWLVASDGGMFTFGDATYYGSVPEVLPGTNLNAPVVGILPQGMGYMLVAADGGIFNFGNSNFHGSIPGIGAAVALPTGGDVVAVTAATDRSGYSMLGADGVIWPFGSFETNLGAHRSVPVAQPPVPGDVDCPDFATQAEAQRWFDVYSPFYGDVAGLDADDDFVACENLP